MSKFRTRFDKFDVVSDSGKPYEVTYTKVIDKNGVADLQVTGKVFIPDLINSHVESVDLHCILARFANGEEDALKQRAAFYFDATDMPSNLAEMYRTVANGEDIFNRLPVEVRSQFNNSFTEFISSIGSDKFNSIFYDNKPVDNGSVVKEDVTDES